MSCECIKMDDDFHSTVNHSYDGFVPELVTQDAGEHPELSILFKIKRHEGGLLPPFLLTTEAASALCDEAVVLRPTNISFLNKYEAVFEFTAENDVNNLRVSLQKVDN